MTPTLRAGLLIVPVLALALLAPTSAKADRIDGNWCRGLAHLAIDGPTIITPGGTRMSGDYDRHGFRYVVPTGEPGAGATISMVQLSEQLMQLSSSAKPGDVQDWTRCQRQIS